MRRLLILLTLAAATAVAACSPTPGASPKLSPGMTVEPSMAVPSMAAPSMEVPTMSAAPTSS